MSSSEPRPIGKRLVINNRYVGVFVLLLASAWVALVNGQPLFNIDTPAYVRGADFAVVYFLGPKFATSWTQDRTRQGMEQRQKHEVHEVKNGGEVRLNSPFDQAVIAGRSIYYGALLYVGHISSEFWLVVFTQAAVFLYLSYTLMIKCLRLSFVSFVCVTAIILAATPVSFFISVLMPDVFAGFLIVSVVIVIAFWDTLKPRDKVILCFVILYSALTHTSHLVLLIWVVSVLAIISFLVGWNAKSHRPVRSSLAVLLALGLVGILGELGFSYAVRDAIGVDPIRPPFLMSRMIADGPGYQFLRENCATKPYTVCKYLDHLPVSGGEFLWSVSPTNGVFSVADLPTRRALSSEQASFAIDVFRFDPAGVIASAASDFFRQFFKITLDSFYLNEKDLADFATRLPASYFDAMTRSRIATREWLLQILGTFYFFTYVISLLALVLIAVSSYSARSQRRPQILSLPEWRPMLTVVGLAIVSNAAICGILSGPASRYQTRVSWIPLFILGLIAAKFCEAKNCKVESGARLRNNP